MLTTKGVKRITIPVRTWEHEHMWYAAINRGGDFEFYASAGTEKKAKAKLEKNVLDVIDERSRTDRNYGRLAIATVGGEILLVEWRHDCWGYSIIGKGWRGFGLVSMGGTLTFQEAIEAARKHASDSYGGIAWEG